MRYRWIVAGMLLLAVGMTATMVERARSQPAVPPPIPRQIAAAAKLVEGDVDKMLKELGPAISRTIARGEKVEIAGLGVFRVVNVPEHKDLVQGRPATIPAVNYIEFLPAPELVRAANAPTAIPAVIVPPFELNPLPNQMPATRTPTMKVPSIRTP